LNPETFEVRRLQLFIEQRRKIEAMIRELSKGMAETVKRYRLTYPKTGAGGFFRYNTALKNEVDRLLTGFHDSIENLIHDATVRSASLSGDKFHQLIIQQVGRKWHSVIVDKGLLDFNVHAFESWISRSLKMSLSDRVWKSTAITNSQIELYLGTGIAEGKSAAALSRDVRSLLVEPNKLFRRVRDPVSGKLVLSDAARRYHPGRGVYRSSYKNAMRLTRTEINMAYHFSDFYRRQNLPFVYGIEVHLSAAHPRPDICDEMQGRYPPGFLFMGWHPQCICYSTSILPETDKFINYMKTGQLDQRRFLSAIPPRADRYLTRMKPTFDRWKSPPLFMQYNFTDNLDLKEVRI